MVSPVGIVLKSEKEIADAQTDFLRHCINLDEVDEQRFKALEELSAIQGVTPNCFVPNLRGRSSRGRYHNTLLGHVLSIGKLNIAEWLISHGADPNYSADTHRILPSLFGLARSIVDCDPSKKTAEEKARKIGAIRFLITCGADPLLKISLTKKLYWLTSLDLADLWKDTQVMSELLGGIKEISRTRLSLPERTVTLLDDAIIHAQALQWKEKDKKQILELARMMIFHGIDVSREIYHEKLQEDAKKDPFYARLIQVVDMARIVHQRAIEELGTTIAEYKQQYALLSGLDLIPPVLSRLVCDYHFESDNLSQPSRKSVAERCLLIGNNGICSSNSST